MAGHSKWKQIKRKKAVTDARRGALFTKLIREITIAAKQGGGDPGGNARLRTAIDAAKAENMPTDNIERAIKKGTGELEGVTYDEVTYEGYGPGGVAILVQALTENRNRTVADVRSAFQKFGGNLGASGSVAWMFQKCGLVTVERANVDEDRVMEVALDAGADDVRESGDILEVVTAPDRFEAVKTALEKAGVALASAEVTMMPQSTVPISGKTAEQMVRLLETLEDHDDVQSVSSNMDIAAEVEERGVGLRHVASGTIALGARGAPAARLARLHAQCLRLVGRWAPGAVAVERAFVARNVQSALRLGEARGAVLAAVAAAGAALHEYTPAEV